MRCKIRLLSTIVLLISLVIGVAACQSQTSSPQVEKKAKVGLLVEGNIFDQSWDSLAYQMLRKVERELQADVTYYEFHGASNDERIESEAIKMIEQGYHIIIGHGAEFQDTFNQLGARYPDVTFIFCNGVAKQPNVFAINFTAESMGFFAGVGAALMTTNEIVGVITAFPKQKELFGFEQGIKLINPNVKIVTDSVGNWGDRLRGKQIAYQLINQGADVVVGFGDGFNIEVINAARERGIYAIGFLTDQSFIARDTVLYSVTQNVEGVYMDVIQLAINGQLSNHDLPMYDFGNGGQGISSFSDIVPQTVISKVNETLERYVRGEISIQTDVAK